MGIFNKLIWDLFSDNTPPVQQNQGTKKQSKPTHSNSNNKKTENKQSENTSIKVGDLVKFKSTANVYYNAKNGDKLHLSEEIRNREWYVDGVDTYSIGNIVFLTAGFEKIKARISDLTISDSVNQSSNSVTQSTGKEKNMVHNDNYSHST